MPFTRSQLQRFLLNGDSPLFNSQTLSNPIQYYGFDTDKSEPQLAHYNTEGILCPALPQHPQVQAQYLCKSWGLYL